MRGLRLDPARMRANLDLGGGLIMAEAVMLDLGAAIGRQHAHDAVYDAAQDAFLQGKPFGDLLAADPRVTAHMTPDPDHAPARPHRLHRSMCGHGPAGRGTGACRRDGVADMTVKLDVDHLRSWIGKQETVHDQVTRFPIAALSATLDRDDPAPRAGDPLPPLWHWLYFLPTARQSILGPDGHPARGGFLPPVPLPRRMWAGGRFTFHQPLRVDETITRTSTVQDVTIKHGRNGALCFVLVKHEVSGHERPGVGRRARHRLSRHAATQRGSGRAARPVRTDDVWRRDIVTRATPLLFRYSALTFNSHRIHYDRRYVTETEGYPGLIVHGPLIATLLIDLLRRNTPADRSRRSASVPSARCSISPRSRCMAHRTAQAASRCGLAMPTGHLAMEAEATLVA